jgi:hypothetical protein
LLFASALLLVPVVQRRAQLPHQIFAFLVIYFWRVMYAYI